MQDLKLNPLVSIIVFVSSYSPLGAILIIKDYDFSSRLFHNPKAVVGIAIAMVLSVIMLVVTISWIKVGPDITIKRISNRSNELVNYTIPYMISFFGFDLGKWQDMASFGIFMILMCVLTIRTQSLFINPILAVIGYGLYDIEFTMERIDKQGIFISDLELETNTRYTVRKLSRFLYFVTGRLKKEGDQ